MVADVSAPRVRPLRLINPGQWQGQPVPEREWLVPGICVRGGATLLNGDGGIGKSLLCLQLQTAIALGKPWLGLPTPMYGTKSIGIYCEDDDEELHRRQADINRYYGCDYDEIAPWSTMISRVGEDSNTLMTFSRREGGGTVTNLFRQIEGLIVGNKIELVIIDTAADTFGGNEIDREQVRTFVQRLRTWAIKTRGSILLTQHPSQRGREGSGESGSTAWHNSARARVYLTAPRRVDDDGDEIPTNERFLKFQKSNYGPKNAKLRLAWDQGVLKTVTEVGPGSLFDELTLREKLLDCASEYVKQGIGLSPDANSRTALVNRIRKDRQDLAHLSQSSLIKAQETLKADGRLVTTTFRNAKRMMETYMRPSWLRYPAEEGETP